MSDQREGIIRAARLSDVDAIVRVHIESTQDAYAPLARTWPGPDGDAKRAHWASWLNEDGKDTNRVDLVADVEGSVAAFVSAGPARQGNIGTEFEIYVIHVLPQCRGAGLGARLWNEVCQRIRGESLRSLYVATIAELRCCSFYEARGGQIVSRRPRMFHGAAVTDVIYLWPAGASSEAIARGPSSGVSRAGRA
jgi:ribosomal protein S18 acetylase RimI-like enzyme